MSRSQRITTAECFTPEQQAFFRAYTEICKFYVAHPPSPMGYAPMSQEARQLVMLEFNLAESERISGLKKSMANQFCQKNHIAQFNFDDTAHRDLLIPEIVSLNDSSYLKNLSQRDYVRVIKRKSDMMRNANHEKHGLEEASEAAVSAGAPH